MSYRRNTARARRAEHYQELRIHALKALVRLHHRCPFLWPDAMKLTRAHLRKSTVQIGAAVIRLEPDEALPLNVLAQHDFSHKFLFTSIQQYEPVHQPISPRHARRILQRAQKADHEAARKVS